MIRSVSFIGSGNVATHMARALFKNRIQVRSIFSRSLGSAKELAVPLNASAIKRYADIDRKSDLYIIAVPDDRILKVSKSLYNQIGSKQKVVHTSGATSTSGIEDTFTKSGCAWPLQSLSKEKRLDFRKVPICVCSSNKSFQKELKNVFGSVASTVKVVTDKQKRTLHLAAVFANNFSNHMFTLAHSICIENDLDFDMLVPLIEETVDKVKEYNPADMQTGPAARDDKKTMKLHISLLEQQKEYAKLYKELSKSIQKHKP